MKDFLGRNIEKGSIVARAIHSGHTFHRVLKITPKGIRLSRGKAMKSYTYRSYRTGEMLTHSWEAVGGSSTIEGIKEHNESIYLRKNNVSLILVWEE